MVALSDKKPVRPEFGGPPGPHEGDPKRLMAYLDRLGIPYEVFLYKGAWAHNPAEMAPAVGLPAEVMAQASLIEVDSRFAIVVLPVGWSVDLERMKGVLQTRAVRLATPEEVKHLFPTCEAGAVPPFGKLYDLVTYLDIALVDQKEIAFQFGNARRLLKMSLHDFAKLTRLCLGDFRLRPFRMAGEY